MHVTFTAYEQHWERNLRDSQSAHAKVCAREAPGDDQSYGVAVFASGYPRIILEPADALRLANQLADALTAIRASTTERNT